MNSRMFKIEERENLVQRLFFSLMPAAIIIMLSSSINSIVDGMIASNLVGSNAIAAIGYYTPFISILIGISSVLSSGSLIICGNRLGKGNENGANSMFTTDVIVTGVIMLVISFIMFFCAPAAARILGAEAVVKENVVDYIRGIAFSFLPMYLGNHMSLFLEIEQKHMRNYAGIAAMVVVNVIADLFFITVLNLGCFGLGLATTVSGWLYFIILGQYYLTDKSQLKLDMKSIDLSLLPQVIVIGFPSAVLQIYLALRGYLYNRAIIHYAGESGMAAFAAVSSFSSIFYAFTNGIAVASRTLYSLFCGSEDRESVQTVTKVAMFRAFPVNIAISVVFTAFAGIFTDIYFKGAEAETYNMAMTLFRICPFALSLSTAGSIFSALYQCQGRMKIVNIMSVTDGLLGVCLSMLILCPIFKIYGVWLSWLTNNFFVILEIVLYTRVFCGKWPGKLEDWLVFKDDFGVPEQMRLNLTVHNEEDVVSCSEKVMDFFKTRGKDEKQSYFAGLALEEMAGNIVSHGYKKDNRKHNANIECIDFGEKIVIHVMDNCIAFDPLSKSLIFDPEDPAKNMGIRLVQRMAKDIKYYRMVGINVLTITL